MTLGGIELSPYTDADYVFVGALYSLTVPDAMPWFSTREQFELAKRRRRAAAAYSRSTARPRSAATRARGSRSSRSTPAPSPGRRMAARLRVRASTRLPWAA